MKTKLNYRLKFCSDTNVLVLRLNRICFKAQNDELTSHQSIRRSAAEAVKRTEAIVLVLVLVPPKEHGQKTAAENMAAGGRVF